MLLQALFVAYRKLEGLNEANGFVDRAANWEVVDGDLSVKTKLRINIKKGTRFTDRRIPLGSMMNSPRSAIPSSSIRTP